jgi:hypothetical protein
MISELCFPDSQNPVMHVTKLTQLEPFTDPAPSDFDNAGYDYLCDVKHNPTYRSIDGTPEILVSAGATCLVREASSCLTFGPLSF